ncbi:HAD family hydrolase [Paenibacillus mesophilus]|uniref:HAD family hydrolase n=1 Tax=Paenibacillus mesophilus TaxID=2582849 RepID=UPI00110F1328|nr:HAD family hydrolase [Paenibacillus mesophilus]TMV49543.1 HAD family hydrolase [Paenibacillus mesophilus]
MKLLVFDVEGTIFKTKIRLPGTKLDSTIWQSLAYSLGASAIQEEINTHLKWERGLYKNYFEWMEETVVIHKKHKLSRSVFSKIINSAEYNNGVKEFFHCLDRNKYTPILISGGFQELAQRAQIDLNIKHSFTACQYFFSDNGELQFYNLLPSDFLGKVHFVKLMLKEYGLNEQEWIFVGDGKNDIEIVKSAPISVGFTPHKELEEIVDYSIDNFRTLLDIL